MWKQPKARITAPPPTKRKKKRKPTKKRYFQPDLTDRQSNKRREAWFRRTNQKLRRNMTRQEWILAGILADNNINFVAQQRIGPYFADFLLPQLKIVVEVDGSQHLDQQQAQRDEKRTKEIERRGFKVVRFMNWQVRTAAARKIVENITKVAEKPVN